MEAKDLRGRAEGRQGHEDELHATIDANYDRDEVVGELAQLEVQDHYRKTQGESK